MPIELFAGIYVSDFGAARAWYSQLFGCEPDWEEPGTEAVWELAEHRSVAIEHGPDHAGHATLTVFVENFDALVGEIGARGLDPAKRDTYNNGVRKALFRDPDGNEIGFGGAPLVGG